MNVARLLNIFQVRDIRIKQEGTTMKRLFWVILAVSLGYGAAESAPHRKDGRFGLFYGSLSPHGEWIEMSFGTAWRPYHTGNQWRPYMRGRWIWTDYGWYWNSYEPFGWATYHYGRWTYDDYYGWIWVPDDVWGPAWVEWRYDDDYIGWSPLPPHARFSVSVGITFGRHWVAPVHYWNFVPCGNFSSVHVVNYVQSPDVTRRIIGRTRSAGSVRSVDRRIVNDGIGFDRIERRSREKIRKVEVVERDSPGEETLLRKNNRDRIEVYRPGAIELRKEGVVRGRDDSPGRDDAPGRNDSRDSHDAREGRYGQRPAAGTKGDRTFQRESDPSARQAQRPAGRPDATVERPGSRQARPDVRPSEPDRRRQRPEVKINRPDVKRNSPGVTRERPSVRREKPDGGNQRPRPSGKRGRDG